jgi:hypothetical protein
VKLGMLLGLCALGLVLGLLVYFVPVVGISATGLLVMWILAAKYPQPTSSKLKENEKPNESAQPSEEKKDEKKEKTETEEMIQEDSEGDGLMTMGEDDIMFPPEDFDEDE